MIDPKYYARSERWSFTTKTGELGILVSRDTTKNIWNLQFWLDVKNSDESYLRELASSVYSWIPDGNYITVSDPEASGNEVLGFRLFSFDTTHWRDTGMVRTAGTEYFEILQKI